MSEPAVAGPSSSAPGGIKTPRIMIGMPIGTGSLPWATALSLMKTVRACREGNVPCVIEVVAGCSVVTWARSAIADAFLKSDCTKLMWIDSDVVWEPADFFRIVGFGAVLPVVGATYPFKKAQITFLINPVGKPGEFEVNGLGCVKVTGMGLGFTLVDRAVMEKVAAEKPQRRDPMTGTMYADIFRIDHEGEDLAFFADVRKHGYDVWLDPSVEIGHHGAMIFKGSPIDAMGLQGYTKEFKK